MCVESGNQGLPAIVADGQSGSIIAWQDSRLGGSDIYAQRVSASGNTIWSAGGVAVCTAEQLQDNVRLIGDFSSGAILVWRDGRSGPRHIYAQRVDDQGIGLWPFNGVPLCTRSSHATDHSIITDGSSGVISSRAFLVGWVALGDIGSTWDAIRIQRVDLDGTGLWAPAATGGIAVASNHSVKSGLVMVTDGVGGLAPKGAVMAWVDRRNGAEDIYARRVDSSGVPQWTSDGIPICAVSGVQDQTGIAFVGSEQVVVVWRDARIGPTDIYAQKIDSSGNVQWLVGGLPVCRATGIQEYPAILRDGVGGAFIIWRDARDGESRIYAQRIDGNGQPMWALDGIPVCSASGALFNATMVSDGTGGFLATWRDQRGADSGDIYAQRVDASGTILFAPAGVPVCLSAGVQAVPVLTASSGGAIVAWADGRTGTASHIYANLVSPSGGVTESPWAAGAEVAAPRLTLVSQNPTRGAVRFELQLPSARAVAVDVWDVTGRCVRTLTTGNLGAGTHSMAWDGTSDRGARVGAGVYFVRLAAGDASATSRVVVVR